MPAIMALAWTAWQQLELFLFLTALMPKGLMQIQPLRDFGMYIESLGEIKYWHDFNSNIASVNDSRWITDACQNILIQFLPNFTKQKYID